MIKKYHSGNTHLIKINAFCKRYSLPNLFIKEESKNPFGTFKDRRSELIIDKAVDKHVDKLYLITSRNLGFSLTKFAKKSKIKIVSIIDLNLSFN